MTLHQLRKLEEGQPAEMLFTMVSPKHGFRELLLALKDDTSDSNDVMNVLRVLAKTVQSSFSPQNLIYLLQMILQTNFLMGPVMKLFVNSNIVSRIVEDLVHVITCFQERMPSQALSVVTALLPQMHFALKRSFGEDIPSDIRASIKSIEKEMMAAQEEIHRGNLLRDRDKDHKDEPDAPGDFRKLSVIPSSADIHPETRPFIRKNRVEGSYKNADEYLDVQFRLLREDCIKPLRDGIKEYIRNKTKGENKRLQDIRVYEKARILEPYCGKRAVVHLIQFDISDLKKVRWETTKRLIAGSLLCFSSDNFQTALFGTIVERDVDELKEGYLYVQFEGLNIQLLNSNPYEEYVMVESGAYFESYVHNLEGLKDFNGATLPFQKYLLCNTEETIVNGPRYLLNKPTKYNFSSVVPDKSKAMKYAAINPLDLNAWPTKEEMGLDESQYQAVQTAITKEFSVIQGPPGTGKTFIGLKICRLLLENKDVWLPNQRTRPILVVCYTNHALDQFLEGILQFMEPVSREGVPQLARLGGRISSENERLQQCLLNNIKENVRCLNNLDGFVERREMREIRRQVHEDKEDIKLQIDHLSGQIEGARTSIIHEMYIEHLMSPNQRGSLRANKVPEGHSLIHKWLLEDWNLPVNQIKNQNKLDDARFQRNHEPGMELQDDHQEFDENDYGGDEEAARRIIENVDIDKRRHLSNVQGEVLLSVQRLELTENGTNDDETEEGWTKVTGKANVKELKKLLNSQRCMTEAEANAVRNVWKLNTVDRWRLYHYWMAKYCEDKMMRMRTLHGQYEAHARRLSELYDDEDYRMLRHCAVIGMTTTGAAKYRRLVKRIAPLIVIVEEAAEVLEAHIITSLNEVCQHVILIGDHQQLKPNPTVYELGTKYHLNISLFERMVKNKMHCDTLRIQHRMRPEIAELIVPHIYKELENHESVALYENIKGVQQNLFFISHTKKELSQEDTRSHSNIHEAEYVTALYGYFLKQGYEPSQITILTLYTGQMFEIRRMLDHKRLARTRVTPVDNYQGEENDIILLSLVRSNEMRSIGFLKISNRVCVALSRAKKGFFVIGNMTQMEECSFLWLDIIKSLEQKNRVVKALPLTCQNHPDTITLAELPDDFQKAPEGGCMRQCDFRLECGHVCVFKCHPIDPEHRDYQCEKPCSKRCDTNGDDGHLCRKRCYQPCGKCNVLVEKVIPGCGHKQDVPCHQDPKTFPCQAICEKPCSTNDEVGHLCRKKCCEPCGDCPVLVAKEIPWCHHTQAVPCYQDPEHYQCQMTCNRPCITNDEDPHLCKKKCSESCGRCTQAVRKLIPSCGHFQRVPCHQDPETFKCQLPCERKPYKCVHPCQELCGEACPEKCSTKYLKSLPCGHEMKTECFKEVSELKCLEKIQKELPCGHEVNEICSTDFSQYNCKKQVEVELECGHKARMACHQKKLGLAKKFKCQVKVRRTCQINSAHTYTASCSDHFRSFFGCGAQCNAQLPCGHICQGKCGNCLDQHHPPCMAPCPRQLPCFHHCRGKCGEPCRPCQESCSNSCTHKICFNKCGDRCAPCHKECPWTCDHQQCNRKCRDLCDREPCSEPCPLLLFCGHRCLGFCGEPCPQVCYVCNGFWLQQALNDIPFTEHTRMVRVLPCHHIIESSALEAWFGKCVAQNETHVTGFFTCPRCLCKVSFCPRFGHVLKKNAKEQERIQDKLHYQEKAYMKEITDIKEGIRRIIISDEEENKELHESQQVLTKTKNKRKQNTTKDNWFSNSEILISRLMEVLQNSVQRNNDARHPKYWGILDFPVLSRNNEQNDIQRIQGNDLTYLIACVLRLYKISQENDSNIKLIMQTLLIVLSGVPLQNTEARLFMESTVTGEDWEEMLMMTKSLNLDKIYKVKSYWRQRAGTGVWVACSKGKITR